MRNNISVKIIVCGEKKTHEATRSTTGDEFNVNLEEKWFV
jgi:hypothetical protein